ncbi:MAG TPA: sensor histidine kinase KdpD [Thermomicrobiales bacterium]|nr:sensor histidine kinase KdpD [Thermomicrobiales bacterium]
MKPRDDVRPDPDELLDRYDLRSEPVAGGRGMLRVFLGAAPGVGKTWQMLDEGRRLRAAGEDVVVGYVETHGRAETAARIGDLEIVPRRQIDYRGKLLEELDLETVIARHPDVALIDELAHTNVPGSRNEKRWMDIEELLDAGVDVITTVNIQHIESLNGTVGTITGVAVRETVPDWVLAEAAEVQLVDLSVPALIERLKAGKVYETARAEQALRGFFRAGNLTALRELALRQTASTVDDQLDSYMRGHEIDAVWGAADRILVVLDPDLPSDHAVRSAWRLAAGFRAELVALAVVSPGDTAARERLSAAVRLAEDLGATVHTLEHRDRIAAIAQAARDENASTLVVPYRPGQSLRSRLGGGFVDRLFEALDGVDVHLVEAAR